MFLIPAKLIASKRMHLAVAMASTAYRDRMSSHAMEYSLWLAMPL